MSASWQAPDLTEEERHRLTKWLPVESEAPPFAVAGYLRNLNRHAEAWGPVLIAALIERGVLGPEGNPLVALDELVLEARGTPDEWVGMPVDAPFRCCECDWRGTCGTLSHSGDCPACSGSVEPL